jgi:outer membrane protein TolC
MLDIRKTGASSNNAFGESISLLWTRRFGTFWLASLLSNIGTWAQQVRGLEHDAETMQAESQSVEASEESLHLTQINYQAGLINYLQVLAADIQDHQAKLSYLQAQAQRLQDTTALFVALCGGWWSAADVLSVGIH